jgi:hypothetical protein
MLGGFRFDLAGFESSSGVDVAAAATKRQPRATGSDPSRRLDSRERGRQTPLVLTIASVAKHPGGARERRDPDVAKALAGLGAGST